jgi:DNA (cytosine-5)-methyltransferase 1
VTTRRSVLSLFSGCGGLDLGFVQAGFHIKLAIDNWRAAVDTYRANEKLLGGEIVNKSLSLKEKEFSLDELPYCEVVLGGPPCQGFSFAGRQFLDDPRNTLYRDFVKIVSILGPRVFLLENVRGMEAMALEDAVAAFSAYGYKVTAHRALATDFGIAQRRERLIIVGFRKDLNVDFTPPTSIYGGLFKAKGETSILDAVGDLPEPIETTQDLPSILQGLPQFLRSHAYRPLPESVQKFVRHIPNGGCFRDAPIETLPERLKKIVRSPARYRTPRLFPKPDPNEPAQTVPADTNPSLGGVLAPDFDYSLGLPRPTSTENHICKGVYTSPRPSRRFTPREAARLQTFPDEFQFPVSLSSQYRLIGNAVPVRLAYAFAEHILSYLIDLDRKKKPLSKVGGGTR